MRPAILNPLFAEATSLSGVGAKTVKLLGKVLGTEPAVPRAVDVIFHLPFSIVDRSYRPKLRDAESGRIATVSVNILEYEPRRLHRHPFRVIAADDTAAMEVVFFTGQD